MDRLHEPELGGREPLHFSSLLNVGSNLAEGRGRESDGDNHRSLLARAAMVPKTSGHEHSSSAASSSGAAKEPLSASNDAGGTGPSLADPRLAGIREILQEKVDGSTIDAAFRAWEPGTIRNYSSHWAKWVGHCDANGQPPFVVNHLALANWLGQLVLSKSLGESTISSAATVVTSTWELINDPAVLISKIKKAAGKINKPTQKKVKSAWDLPYLHLYIGGEDGGSPDSSYESPFTPDHKGMMEEAICLLKGATGWRQDDVAGVHFDFNLQFTPLGAYVSTYDSKIGQRVHSAPVFLPSLAPRFARIDAVRALRRVNDFVIANKAKIALREIKDKSGEDCTATPLFTYAQKGKFYALAPGTVGNYFKRAFLDNVSDGPEAILLSARYAQHSSRHAVASALFDMGVPPSAISAVTLNSAATLQQTYILPVVRSYLIPEDCVNKQKSLPLKLLLPYVHYHTSSKDGEIAVPGTCGCDGLQLQ
jgi:hypothetical protein